MTTLGVTGWGGSHTSLTYAQQILANAPVVYYRHEAGALEIDSSGNGHDATSTVNVSEVAGIVGNAGSYNGTSSRQAVPAAAGLNDLMAGSSILTVEALINPSALVTARSIMGKGWVQTRGWLSYLNGSGTLGFGIHHSTTDMVFQSTTALSTGTPYHVVMVFSGDASGSGGTKKMYINGASDTVALVSAGVGTRPTDAGDALDIGVGRSSVGTFFRWFSGLLDEVALYNRELSAAEVAADFALSGI